MRVFIDKVDAFYEKHPSRKTTVLVGALLPCIANSPGEKCADIGAP